MSVTAESYERALDDFTSLLHEMGEDVTGALLFGSLVRGEVSPGRSDIMDAFVFLRGEVFRDRARYLDALQVMAACCEKLAESGIPFHPFFYWDDSKPVSAMFLPPFLSGRYSRVVVGEDVRPRLRADADSRAYARDAFFAARRKGHALSVYLARQELTGEERKRIAAALLSGRKYFPLLACLALDRWVGESEMVRELEEAFPDLDTTVLSRSKVLRAEPESIEDTKLLLGLLRDMLTFVEALHERIAGRPRDEDGSFVAGEVR